MIIPKNSPTIMWCDIPDQYHPKLQDLAERVNAHNEEQYRAMLDGFEANLAAIKADGVQIKLFTLTALRAIHELHIKTVHLINQRANTEIGRWQQITQENTDLLLAENNTLMAENKLLREEIKTLKKQIPKKKKGSYEE